MIPAKDTEAKREIIQTGSESTENAEGKVVGNMQPDPVALLEKLTANSNALGIRQDLPRLRLRLK